MKRGARCREHGVEEEFGRGEVEGWGGFIPWIVYECSDYGEVCSLLFFFVGSFNDNDFAESNVFEAVLRYVALADVRHCVGSRYVCDSVCQRS